MLFSTEFKAFLYNFPNICYSSLYSIYVFKKLRINGTNFIIVLSWYNVIKMIFKCQHTMIKLVSTL